MSVSHFRHPPRAGKVAVVHDLRATRLARDVDAKDQTSGLSPIRPVCVSVEQPQIVGEMAIILGRKFGRIGRAIIENFGVHLVLADPPSLTN